MGGQRQRTCIAQVLAVNPKFIVCDESVAALDVSIQAQVLNLLMRLREEFGLTYLFISHDLGVVEHISDRVAIMYLGRIVELGPTEDIFATPNHPYTQALIAEVPRIDARKKTFAAIKGEIPSPLHPPAGCHFHPRCPHAFERCRRARAASTRRGVEPLDQDCFGFENRLEWRRNARPGLRCHDIGAPARRGLTWWPRASSGAKPSSSWYDARALPRSRRSPSGLR